MQRSGEQLFPSKETVMQTLSFPSLRAVLAASACLALPAFATPTYTLTVVEPGSTNCGPTSINDQGMIAGACGNDAVVWRNGVRVTLGRLDKGTSANATYVNANGVAVGDGDTGDGRPLGWVSTSSGLYNFFSNNGGNTRTHFITDNGTIAGKYVTGFSGQPWIGAIWTPNPKDPRKYNLFNLPSVPPGNDGTYTGQTEAGAFNHSLQAAGWVGNSTFGQHAAFWNNDAAHTLVDLGTLPGSWTSLAYGINDLGQVVGESLPPSARVPALWNNDAAHTASALPYPAGDNLGVAQGINNLGHVIGWTGVGNPGVNWDVYSSHYVVWRDGTVYDLTSVLDPVTGAGCTVTSANGINNAGQIVGFATCNGAINTMVVLTPQ